MEHEEDKHNGSSSAAGYFFSSAASAMTLNSGNYGQPGQNDVLGLQAGMELLGLPSGNHHHHQQQRYPESSGIGDPTVFNIDESSFLYQQQQSLPQQGLSLSLCNNNDNNNNPKYSFREQQQQHMLMINQDWRFSSDYQQQQQEQQLSSPLQQLRSCKYLIPAQELLNEFVSLGSNGSNNNTTNSHDDQLMKSKKSNFVEGQQQQWPDSEGGGPSSLSSSSASLYNSLDLLALQKRKERLLSMLEEVDRRYRRYRDQMRAVVSSFEAVAGEASAAVYTTLASKAMSRHFRCLRDGIVNQIKATKKAMGGKDPVAPGTTRGETPRLRLLDQCFRQQKAFQQGGGFMENHPWRPQRGLPERAVSILRAWLFEHFLHPYPSDVDKHILARQTGLSRSQVSNWFINARVRLWKPMVEEMYVEEFKEEEEEGQQQQNSSSSTAADDQQHHNLQFLHSNNFTKLNPNPNITILSSSSSLLAGIDQDHKPLAGLHADPDSLTSVVNTRNHHSMIRNKSDSFIDFQSYNNHHSFISSTTAGGGGVSLTLGLQQNNSVGNVGIAFSPAVSPHQQSLFFSRDQIDDCQQNQFSILDGDNQATQNLHYRNFASAQLLHDLVG